MRRETCHGWTNWLSNCLILLIDFLSLHAGEKLRMLQQSASCLVQMEEILCTQELHLFQRLCAQHSSLALLFKWVKISSQNMLAAEIKVITLDIAPCSVVLTSNELYGAFKILCEQVVNFTLKTEADSHIWMIIWYDNTHNICDEARLIWQIITIKYEHLFHHYLSIWWWGNKKRERVTIWCNKTRSNLLLFFFFQ